MSYSSFRVGFIFVTIYSHILVFVALVICPLPTLSETVPQHDLDALQNQLQQTGWQVQRSSSGDLLLWPSGKKTAADSEDLSQDNRIPSTDLETLKKRLQKRGWRVEQDADKSLLLYPLEGENGEAVQSMQAPAADSGRMDELQRLLTNSGWRTRKTDEGDLLLYPTPASVQSAPPTTATDLYVKPSELWRVRDILKNAGWRLEKESDGSILLFPVATEKSGYAKHRKRYVPGIVVSTLFNREIELPVDSMEEVIRISNSWLADQQTKGLTVGKIRKVNWIYLVSIVEDSEPYRLSNQLAIRESDGTVIPLH